MKTLIKLKKPIKVESKWANLNKNDTLDEYKKLCDDGDYQISFIKYDEILMLDNDSFEEISNNLLSNLEEFAGKGGAYEDYSRAGLQVINTETGEIFYVDPQGYDYARYVGIPV